MGQKQKRRFLQEYQQTEIRGTYEIIAHPFLDIDVNSVTQRLRDLWIDSALETFGEQPRKEAQV